MSRARSALGFMQFRKSLLKGTIEPVYLFEGEEQFFHEEGIGLLENAALAGGNLGLDRESLRGGETTMDAVLDLASTYPMGGGRRVVVVREASGLRCDAPEILERYLARPNPKGCLVFSDVNFDKRRSLYRILRAGAATVDCAPLHEARLALWVRERLQERGYGIGPELTEAIASGLAGDGLARLDSELEKLMTSIGAPRPVEAADLTVLAKVPRVEKAFVLAREAVGGDRGRAVASLRDLLRSGEEPVMVLGGLAWYFRTALKARLAGDRRIPLRDMRTQYGIDPGRVERFRAEIGRANASDLRYALRLCKWADRELKGMGAKDPANALERMIHRVARRTGGRA